MRDLPLFLYDGIRIASHDFLRRIKGRKKYAGTINDVCREIIEDAYDRKHEYFMVSSGHFSQFYSRDFGMCCESLMNLGYEEKVRNTLIYAMDIFGKHGRITTHITPSGRILDFPTHAPESAAYMLHSLLLLGDMRLIRKYSSLFKGIAQRIYADDIDRKTGLLRKDKHFTSMKDHAVRQSACYDNCMLGLFARDLKRAGIDAKISKYDYEKIIIGNFWNGEYFIEDLSGKEIVTGDANTFPFWTGLVDGKDIFKKALAAIRKKKLDEPWPMKYTAKEDVPDLGFYNRIVPGYEEDTIWAHLGMCFMKVVAKYDEELLKRYLKRYEALIKKHKTFYEVYSADGKPFSVLLYSADDAMVWCAMFLELYMKHEK